jgi:aminoglycoside phosphotransferase (APT) family kinase protein
MVFADTYLQPDAPDPVLSEESVVAAARRHAPDVGGLIEVDESGGEARAYILEGGIVLKTQRPHRLRPRTSLEKEALFLRELERQGDFPVPRALGYGRVDGIEYLCLTRMAGTAVEQLELEQDDRAAVLVDVGRTLRTIHECDQASLLGSDLIPGDRTPADLRIRFADTFDRLATALEARDDWGAMIDVRSIATTRLSATPDDVPPVALHSNPGPEHAFAEPATRAFTGLIDFGDAYASHPALDLRPWTADEDAASVLAGYQSLGSLPESFEDVVLTGRVIVELARAARGMRKPEQTAKALQRLLA